MDVKPKYLLGEHPLTQESCILQGAVHLFVETVH